MLLLYRKLVIIHQHVSVFTFHYASTLSHRKSCMKRQVLRFTFHYASTLSVTSTSDNLRTLLFTFHYASTLSGLTKAKLLDLANLHSTMLLLYPVPLFPFYFLQYKYTLCLPFFLHWILLKNLPTPTLQNMNFP